MMANTLVTRITSVERLGCSVYGNPYFRVFVTDEPYVIRTQIDSALSYGIENRTYLHTPVRMHLTRAGRVYDIDVLEGE